MAFFSRFGHDAKIVHFIGVVKPWQHRYLPEVDAVILFPGTYAAEHAAMDYIRRWWRVFNSVEQVGERGGGERGRGGEEERVTVKICPWTDVLWKLGSFGTAWLVAMACLVNIW